MANTPPTLTELYNAAKTQMLALITRSATFVSFDGRQYNYHDLDKLRKLMADLRTQIISMGLPDPEAPEPEDVDESVPKRPFCSGFSVNGGML